MARDNKTIGRFHLDSIPPAPRVGVTSDQSHFRYRRQRYPECFSQRIKPPVKSNLSGSKLLPVCPMPKSNGWKTKQLLMQPPTSKKERSIRSIKADSMIFQTEKQLKRVRDKLPADKKAPIEAALQELKEAHKAQDVARINSAIDKLNGCLSGCFTGICTTPGSTTAGRCTAKVLRVTRMPVSRTMAERPGSHRCWLWGSEVR